MSEIINQIREAWKKGKFILIYDSDSREQEVDMIIPSEIIEPKHIAEMRINAGGLICTAISHDFAKNIGLPFLTDVYKSVSEEFPTISRMMRHSLPYGAKSSFSLTINHVDSFTGITDYDRSLTIKTIGVHSNHFQDDNSTSLEKFEDIFRIPGHVHLLIASQGLLKSRLGHTELSIALCEITGLSKSATMCEMMDADTNQALSVEKAKIYAKKMGYPFIDGASIVNIWENYISSVITGD